MSTARAFIIRDFLEARSYRLSFGLGVLLGLLNLLVYYFISRTFTGAATAELSGAPSYFAFAAVGIAMTTVLDAATTAVSVSVRNEQLTGTLEATVSQPVSPSELAIGMSGMPFLMAAARTCVYLALAALLLHLDLSRADWPGVAAVLAASGLALSSLGIASAAMVLVVKRGDVIAAFGSFAIGILSGAVFPLSVLPDWLEPIGRALPTRFAFQGLRQALFGSGSWGGEVLVLLVYAVVLLPAALWAFSAALRVAKRAGSVAEY